MRVVVRIYSNFFFLTNQNEIYITQQCFHPHKVCKTRNTEKYLQSQGAKIKEHHRKNKINYTLTHIQRSGCFH